MNFNRKHIYWGAGILAGVSLLSVFVFKHRGKLKKLKDKAESWIKPVAAKITSPFGNRKHPVTGQLKLHNGIDLAVPVGTQVKSPMSGTIEAVSTTKAGGTQIVISHPNGFLSGYAHLSKALVKKGDKVKQGDVIALSGNTGQSTGPHLHLTMKDATGKYIDPGKVIYRTSVV